MADSREFVKLDVGYLSNPKIVSLLAAKRPLAVLVHVECFCYSRRHRTDGIVPRVVAERAVVGSTRRDLQAAIDAGLLIDREDGTLEVHDYLDHQQSAEAIEKASAAGRKGAAARWGGKGDRNADRIADGNADRIADGNADRIADGNAEKRRGEKNIPTPTVSRSTATPSSTPGHTVRAGLFDAFWQAYPRKVGKRKAAEAFTRAARRTSPATIINGARKLAADPNLPAREFIPHPTTWLNRDGWEDEPLAPRTDSNGHTTQPRPGTTIWDQRRPRP